MGGKQQGGGGSAPTIRPRGPAVSGPTNVSAGPPILARVLGPQIAANNANFDQTRETTANTVGTIAGIVSNLFYPGTGAFASVAANRTVREQFNTFGGRPYFESTEEPLKDWPSILASLAGSYVGSAAGGAAGGAAGTAGQTAGATAGGYIGSQAGGYAGAQAKRAIYGGGQRSRYYNGPYERSYIYGR